MTNVSLVGPDAGEILNLGAIQIRVLEDGGTTDHRLGVIEITIPPDTVGPSQHRHAGHDEGFYVVSGQVRFSVGEDTHDASAGTFVMIPPGSPHGFSNLSTEPAVLLNTFTPDLYVQYFRDLRDRMATGDPLTPAAAAEVMSRYATTPATEFP